jgi:hypothetical protein
VIYRIMSDKQDFLINQGGGGGRRTFLINNKPINHCEVRKPSYRLIIKQGGGTNLLWLRQRWVRLRILVVSLVVVALSNRRMFLLACINAT